MITTNKIEMGGNTLYKILLRLALQRKTLFMFGAAAVLSVVYLIAYPGNNLVFLLLAAVLLFPLLSILQAKRASRNTLNAGNIASRYYVIGDGELTAYMEDGEEEVYNIVRPEKVIRYKDYYLLFTDRIEFLYIPYDAFKSDADRQWFEKEVVARTRAVKKG